VFEDRPYSTAELKLEMAASAKAKIDRNRDFLLAVVNGDDRADSPEKLDYFLKRYAGWFPPLEAFRDHLELSRTELVLWMRLATNDELGESIDDRDIPMEKFHPQVGPHAAILRYKLRVIWKTAESNQESAERRGLYLLTDVRRVYRAWWGCTKHYQDIWDACEWLKHNVTKLRICKNPECASPYFFREEKNQRYCCTDCADEGRRLGWEARRKEAKRELSREGRDKISKAQKERHAEAREARKQDAMDKPQE
jgi:hypothetical protein